MSRSYAGVFGSLAFFTVLVRGLIYSSGPEQTLFTAVVCLAIFATIGLVLGQLADATITEAVRGRMLREAETQQAAKANPTTPTT